MEAKEREREEVRLKERRECFLIRIKLLLKFRNVTLKKIPYQKFS